jgi:hypothetical protein
MLVGGCGDDGVTGEVGSLLDTYCDDCDGLIDDDDTLDCP